MTMREDIKKIQEKAHVLEQESLASEIIRDYKRNYNKLFKICIILLLYAICSTVYLVYTIKETNTEITTERIITQEAETGNNTFVGIGRDGRVYN